MNNFVSQPYEAMQFSLPEIVSALSYALDLTEAAEPGHALRTCLFGMAIAAEVGVPAAELVPLYYALLLKDVGCSSNAGRMCALIAGDDRVMKREVKLLDWTRPSFGAVRALYWHAMAGESGWKKTGRIIELGLARQKNNEIMIRLRCDRGAGIVQKLGLGDKAAEAVRSLDEHWDGSGYPERLRGEAIPLLGRILAVAQHLDVFGTEHGMSRAMEVLKERSGRWFDPALVRVAQSLNKRGKLKGVLDGEDHEKRVIDANPGPVQPMSEDEIDNVCEAFADVVDAKSSFTYTHSLGVTRVAQVITRELGFSAERSKLMYRAALLHDLGKLTVPNTILDKPSRLTSDEWAVVRSHVSHSEEILKRIPAFTELATIAGAHHERLDGSGYPRGLQGEDLNLDARVIALADVFGSLTETRPYRDDFGMEEVIRMVRKDAGSKLDGDCVDALLASVERHEPEQGIAWDADVEVDTEG